MRQIQANRGALAAFLGDVCAVTWGDADSGGDASAVQGQLNLKDVQQIQATDKAFFCWHLVR